MRPYQSDAAEAIHTTLAEFNRALTVMATGSGKTILFAKLSEDCLKRRGAFGRAQGKVLILVNREELLQQARDKILAVTGIFSGIERAHEHADLDSPIIIATIQTLQKRLAKYPADWPSLVIVDEAHLFATPKIIEVLDYFCGPEGAMLLGFTATPHTKGKRALSKVYETIAYEKTIASLIEDGYLCNIKVQTVPIKIDISAVRSAAGDFIDEDIEVAIEPYFVAVAEAMKAHPGRRWLCFLPLIHTSKKFTSILNAHGIHAEHVDGKSEDRADILRRFKDGKVAAMCNSLLVTTGYDEPSITGIVNLRPTKSRIMITQILGRGTRLKPEGSPHDDLLVLDPLWQTPDIEELMTPAMLFAAKDEDAAELSKRLRSGDELDLADVHAMVVADRHKKLADALRANESKKANLMDFRALLALGLEKNHLWEEAIDYEPTFQWEEAKPSKVQIDTLFKFGFDVRLIRDKGHASKVLQYCFDRIKRKLATFKQVRALQRAGYHVDPNELRIDEASRMLSDLYGNRR
jgi:superfamily II DNA or RNA helicase